MKNSLKALDCPILSDALLVVLLILLLLNGSWRFVAIKGGGTDDVDAVKIYDDEVAWEELVTVVSVFVDVIWTIEEFEDVIVEENDKFLDASSPFSGATSIIVDNFLLNCRTFRLRNRGFLNDDSWKWEILIKT